MIVRVAKTAGFCFGVERAVRKAEEMLADRVTPSDSFGPVVHNETVVAKLTDMGLHVVNDESEFPEEKSGRVLIRAHGVGRKTEEMLRERYEEVIDATCPFVRKIHRLVEKASNEGCRILIVGDPDHPEVKGIAGWVNGQYCIVNSEENVKMIPFSTEDPVFVVVQTTFQRKKFKKILEILKELGYNTSIADTVCSATSERQEEAKKLASECDVMLVIGSESSSNSQKLYEICKEKCDHTYFIQQVADIKPAWFSGAKSVGITAGASTPKNLIEEVQNDVRV